MDNFSCLLCGYDKATVIKNRVRDSEEHKIVKCEKCGHVQISPLPSLEEDKEFYDNDMQSKNVNGMLDIKSIEKKSKYDTERRKQLILENVDKCSNILEIGCGHGFLVNELKIAGFIVDGIEISDSRREIAMEICQGNIFNINLMRDNIPSHMRQKYDVILLFQVLEHMINPKKFLKNIKKLLRSDGKIIIEVPNLMDHLLDLCSQYNEFFWQRAHLSYFSPLILNNLFKELEFKNINIYGVQRYSIVNMMNWYINGIPEIKAPSYKTVDDLKWIDEYYKSKLSKELKSDTLVLIATK